MAKPQPQTEEEKSKITATAGSTRKLSTAEWGFLFTGAAMLDLLQPALDAILIGLIANLLIDVVVGLSLAWYFHRHDMLDKKLAISLGLAFGIDFISLGIMPTWIADIGYAWLVTDGKILGGSVPGVEGKAGAAKALMAVKGK